MDRRTFHVITIGFPAFRLPPRGEVIAFCPFVAPAAVTRANKAASTAKMNKSPIPGPIGLQNRKLKTQNPKFQNRKESLKNDRHAWDPAFFAQRQLERKIEIKKKKRKEKKRETGVPCNCSKMKVLVEDSRTGGERSQKHTEQSNCRHAESVRFTTFTAQTIFPPFGRVPAHWRRSDPQRAQTPLRAPGSVGGELRFRLGEFFNLNRL